MDGRDADAVYGVAKVLGEDLARNYQADGGSVTIVRPFSGYGPDQSEEFPFGALVERVRRREAPVTIWGDGSQVRDFIHVDDLCRAILTLVKAEVNRPVNIGTGIPTSMTQLVELAAQIDGFSDVFIQTDREQPAGVAYRVANVDMMLKHYTPRWTLAAGIAQRLSRPPM
jgi:nucleoside-diphosphate-sugar epimerase